MYEVNHDLPKGIAAISEFEKYGHAILDLSIEKFLADGCGGMVTGGKDSADVP